MSKTAIYVRVSTHHQIDKDSLPLQREDLINYTKYALNINDYVIFEDAGYSAKNTDRPDFQNMMTRIRNGEFTHLLVWKIDRISRNLLDFCDMYNELKRYNCTFVSKSEQFDTSSAMGEAMLKIILVFAELERKLTGERVTAVMLDRASKGLWNGAPIPLGYKWNEETKFPVIDDEESETILKIFNRYKDLKSTTLVRNELNAEGIRTKRNGSWTTKTVSDIIRNPFYKGTYRYNFRETARGKKKDKNEWIMLENNHPGIISNELWEECNSIMDNNAQKNSAIYRGNSKTHVFASILECGECHNSLYAKSDKPHIDGYEPSLYACTGRYNNLGCSQKTISDKIVGSFVLQYISNITNLKHNTNLDSIESILLNKLNGVYGIDNNSIKELHNILHNKNTDKYSVDTNNDTPVDYEIEKLNKEKVRYERALKRLDDLYLFDDEAMSEKDYILKKNEMTNMLDSISQKIKAKNIIDSNDINFFKSTSALILKLELNSGKTINYKELILRVGKDALKEFVNTIINKIVIKDKKITSIEFKNGHITRFIYN